jgi:hypothetical protein
MNGASRFPLWFKGLSKSLRLESFQLDLACLTRITVFIVTRILNLASVLNTNRATSPGPWSFSDSTRNRSTWVGRRLVYVLESLPALGDTGTYAFANVVLTVDGSLILML